MSLYRPDKITPLTKEEAAKQLREARCQYPNCKKPQMMAATLPVVRLTETGQPVMVDEGKEMSMQVPVPLCNDHMPYAFTGLLFVMESKGMMKLAGDFRIIQICEAVIKSKELRDSINARTSEGKAQSQKPTDRSQDQDASISSSQAGATPASEGQESKEVSNEKQHSTESGRTTRNNED